MLADRIGSFTWATVSVDTTALINKLAETLGLPPEQLQGLPTDSFSKFRLGMGRE